MRVTHRLRARDLCRRQIRRSRRAITVREETSEVTFSRGIPLVFLYYFLYLLMFWAKLRDEYTGLKWFFKRLLVHDCRRRREKIFAPFRVESMPGSGQPLRVDILWHSPLRLWSVKVAFQLHRRRHKSSRGYGACAPPAGHVHRIEERI